MPSSAISTYQYDKAKQILRVTFISGMQYDYLHVPEHIYMAMKKTLSKGSFLNRFVKGIYPFKKIS